MACKPFGYLAARTEAERARETAEDARLDERMAFDRFCREQRERIAADLKRRMDRISAAKWGDCEGTESHFVVSRKGTTEASGPVHRKFQNVAL